MKHGFLILGFICELGQVLGNLTQWTTEIRESAVLSSVFFGGQKNRPLGKQWPKRLLLYILKVGGSLLYHMCTYIYIWLYMYLHIYIYTYIYIFVYKPSLFQPLHGLDLLWTSEKWCLTTNRQPARPGCCRWCWPTRHGLVMLLQQILF